MRQSKPFLHAPDRFVHRHGMLEDPGLCGDAHKPEYNGPRQRHALIILAQDFWGLNLADLDNLGAHIVYNFV